MDRTTKRRPSEISSWVGQKGSLLVSEEGNLPDCPVRVGGRISNKLEQLRENNSSSSAREQTLIVLNLQA